MPSMQVNGFESRPAMYCLECSAVVEGIGRRARHLRSDPRALARLEHELEKVAMRSVYWAAARAGSWSGLADQVGLREVEAEARFGLKAQLQRSAALRRNVDD